MSLMGKLIIGLITVISFDVEFQINHIATAAVGAMSVLAPIVRYAYA